MSTSLYETDFYAWTREEATKLRRLLDERVNTDLDLENLAEEVESMGRSNRAQLDTRLANLIEHLLKLAFSLAWEPRRQWQLSVRGQRHSITRLLRQNPSLRRELVEVFEDAYTRAVAEFDDEKLIELTMDPLPGLCPFDLHQHILQDEWWPATRGMN